MNEIQHVREVQKAKNYVLLVPLEPFSVQDFLDFLLPMFDLIFPQEREGYTRIGENVHRLDIL